MPFYRNNILGFGSAKIVGGDVAQPPYGERSEYRLEMDSKTLWLRKGILKYTAHLEVPVGDIEELELIGVESRMTATRLATLGIVGAGLKKSRMWIRLVFKKPCGGRSQTLIEVKVTEPEARAYLTQHLPWARKVLDRSAADESPVKTGAEDLVTELERLGTMRREGLLTADEFDKAKRKLLDR